MYFCLNLNITFRPEVRVCARLYDYRLYAYSVLDISISILCYRIENRRKRNTNNNTIRGEKKTINARHTRSIRYSDGGRRTLHDGNIIIIIIMFLYYIVIISLSSLTALSSLRPARHTYAHASPPVMRTAAKD